MKTYQAVRAEIAKLEQKAEALRKNELKTVIAQVKKTIDDYGLSAADLGLGRSAGKLPGRRKATAKRAARVAASAGVPKYRNPKSGETWTGRGRPPAWIAGAKDREAYLIDAPASPAAKKAKPAGKAAAKKTKPAKTAAAKKKAAPKRRKAAPSVKTPAVQIESGAASQ